MVHKFADKKSDTNSEVVEQAPEFSDVDDESLLTVLEDCENQRLC